MGVVPAISRPGSDSFLTYKGHGREYFSVREGAGGGAMIPPYSVYCSWSLFLKSYHIQCAELIRTL